MMPPSFAYDFRVTSYPCRIFSGKNALASLPTEIKRNGSKRAYLICGKTVARNTDLIARIKGILNDSLRGIYDEMGKDTPLAGVLAARDSAREVGADLIIAVGGGSVIQGARAVSILLAEKAPIETLITQYPDEGPAISPKLMADKIPIINVLTIGTSAQNRAGSPVKGGLGHRLEFFDPKTRPVALFWDQDALLTAPSSMMFSSVGAAFWRAAMNMGHGPLSPLVALNRRQVLELMRSILPRLSDPNDFSARLDLCIATYLQNREVDDGGAPARHWVSRVVYAFASALSKKYDHISQGNALAAFAGPVMRSLGSRDSEEMCRIAFALGVWDDGNAAADAPQLAAAELERIFTLLQQPINLSQLDIPRTIAESILEASLMNYNADPNREFTRARALMLETLNACW